MRADAAKLMDAREGANRRVVLNRYMTGQRGRIRHDDVIAEHAVMADVRVRHEKIVIADFRVAAAPFGAAMDIHVLAKDIMVSDRQERLLTLELQILRLKTNCSERK